MRDLSFTMDILVMPSRSSVNNRTGRLFFANIEESDPE